MNLLHDWKSANHKGGALTKLVEMFPEADLVACGVHLNASNFAHALRALSKTSELNVILIQTKVVASTATIGALRGLDLDLQDIQLSSKATPTLAALLDVAPGWFLGADTNDDGDAARKRIFLNDVKTTIDKKINEQINAQVSSLPKMLNDQMDVVRGNSVSR